MIDKQIIIGGVDVLKEKINMCFILLLNKLETSETIEQTIYEHLDAFVEEWNKQLQAKEQECEELKEDRERWKSNFNGKVSAIEELLQQLDQLKAKNIKISKTLIEIKEIAKNMNNECFYDDFDCEDCDMKNGCTYFNKKQILQKINGE